MRVLLASALLILLFASASAAADDECMACHGTKDIQAMTTKTGNFFVDPARYKSGVHRALGCTTCHTTIKEYPHPTRIPKVDCASCHADVPATIAKSAHAALGPTACASCHGSAHTTERAASVAADRQMCATCHSDAVRGYRSSVHSSVLRHGDSQGATCQSCHGPAHKVLPYTDPASPVAKKNLPDTCGSCHANPDFLARHKIDFARPVEAYRLSVHGRAVEAGNAAAPSCSDCHANHAIYRGRDARSKINHWQVTRTCGACHSEIKKTYDESVHGEAVARGVRASPVCTDCHGEHTILAPSEPQSLVNPARVSSVTCGHCHSDERLTQRFNLPLDKVPAYEDSFHGLAMRGGSQTVANCASCHGVHNILPSSDPRSTTNPANLAKTCGSCHPGAGERFSISTVHIRSASTTEHVVVKWIRLTYYLIIPFTIGFMLLHHGIDFLAKLIRGSVRAHSKETVERMNLHFRIEHWLVMLSFPTLVVTGFALKFPDQWWAAPILHWESQFAFRGTVHRVAGVVLIASLVYHVVHLIVSHRDRVMLRYMMPDIRDAQDLISMFKYNLGLSTERPYFGKFSYAEKMEYLAFMWGSAVMALSGFVLWFNNFSLRYFPKWVSDAATAVHYYEAILATLSILIWHFYIVIFDPDVYPMDLAWLTGKASAEHMRHTRPVYLLHLLREPASSRVPSQGEPSSSRALSQHENNTSRAEPPQKTDSEETKKEEPPHGESSG